MSEKINKDLNEDDLPRTPPGRPVAVSPGSNQAKEPFSDCVQRKLEAKMRRGMPRAKAAVQAIRECEKSRPVRGKAVVHVDKAGETLAGDSVQDHEEKMAERAVPVAKVGERNPGESVDACVSRKVAILIREGKPVDVAVAIAHSLCEK